MSKVEKLIEWLDNDWRSIALLMLIVIAFFSPALTTPNVLIWPHSNLGSDISYRHWPDLIGYGNNLIKGRIALWDSFVALGRPLAGDTTVLFLYPFTILFAILPPALAFNVLDTLHVFFAAIFTFLFLRIGYSVSRPASLLSGLTFAFTPKLIAHLAGGHVGLVWGIVWTPAVLLGFKIAIDGKLLGAGLAGLALAISLPSHLQMPYYIAVLASAFWVWHLGGVLIKSFRQRQMHWQRIRWLLIIYVVWILSFALISAVVLLPLLELLPYNSRTNFSVEDANLYALPAVLLITLLVPSNFQFPEWTMFVGATPLLLAGVALLGKKNNVRWFFALFAFFALIFALGTATPLFESSLALIPGFRLLRVPTRLWFLGAFVLAILTGLGAEWIVHDDIRSQLFKYSRLFRLTAVVYIVGAVVALLTYWLLVHQWHIPTALRLAIATLIICVGFAWSRGILSGRTMQWILIPLLLLDIFPLDLAHIDLVDPREEFLRSTPSFDFISSQKGLFRVYSPAGDLPYALAASRGVETLEGLLAFQVGYSGQVIRDATGCKSLHYATAVPPCLDDRIPVAIPDAGKLGLLNVRFVSARFPISDPNLNLVFQSDHFVYENLLWQPRVRIVNGTAEIVKREAGLYDIKASSIEPSQLIVSETWAPGWMATIDNVPVDVERAEKALIGMKIAPGDHLIHLVYDPLLWRIGLPISITSLVLLLIWAIIVCIRKAK